MTCPDCGTYMKFQKRGNEKSPWYCPKCHGYTLVKDEIQMIYKEIESGNIAEQELNLRMQLANMQMQKQQIELQQQQLQVQQSQYNSMLKCPKCGSTSVTGQKKGFGIVKAGLGAAAFGAVTGGVGAIVGLGAGNIGRKNIRCTCMNCGYSFKAGKK